MKRIVQKKLFWVLSFNLNADIGLFGFTRIQDEGSIKFMKNEDLKLN